MMNIYELLGVAHNADQASIEAAYQQRLAEYRLDQPETIAPELRQLAEEQQRKLEQAYQTLSDPERRQRYDSTLNPQPRPLLTKRELLWSLAGVVLALLLLVAL